MLDQDKDFLLKVQQHWINYLKDPSSIDIEACASSTVSLINVLLNADNKINIPLCDH